MHSATEPGPPAPAAGARGVPPSGTLEAVKWIGLAFMVGDHVNAVVFARELPVLTEAGRIAFPLFAWTLGVNLARPDPRWPQTYRRIVRRLLVFAIVSLPFSAIAFQRPGLLPLNILFSFAAACVLVGCIRRNDIPAALVGSVVFLGTGLLVEFSWPGLLLVVASWATVAYPGVASRTGLLAAMAALFFVNGNFYAMLAVPVVLAVSMARPRVPRLRWLFYAFYPAHLAVLALLRQFL